MRYVIVIFILSFLGCNSNKETFSAQQIIDKSIQESGVDKIAKSIVSFTFREKNYSAKRDNGKFELTRSFDSIYDVLSNSGFSRFVNDNKIQLSDSVANLYANSVNSVHYFSVLPFGLNDKAVYKKLLPSTKINGKEYYKIEITFSEDGGGDDFEDVFIYWINKQTFHVDYLAYSYHTNGGGIRFRELKEQCNINEIRFVDYFNYKPKNKTITLVNSDKAFENNELEKVSEVVLKDIKVELLN